MIEIRESKERGHFNFGWLDTYHTFSFGDYYDPKQMGFGPLRVINEDRVQAGQGFGTHPHRDMEILTYVISGELAHKDSMGNGSAIRPGEIQYMSAGTGVTHSEFNSSKTKETHLYQIWIVPSENGLKPRYDQQSFSEKETLNQFKVLASGEKEAGAIQIRQDAKLSLMKLQSGKNAQYSLTKGRRGWVQVISGNLTVNDRNLSEGDGAAVQNEKDLSFGTRDGSEFLFFDLS